MKRTGLATILLLVAATFFVAGCPGKKVPPPPLPPITEDRSEPRIEEPVVKPEPPRELGLKPVYFEYDQYTLTTDARDAVNTNARQLMDNGGMRVRLEGNCDERGTSAYNLSLGHKRAETVKNFLVQYGIGANRIETVSYGEERPVCRDAAENCWWRNRRVDFSIIGK